MYDKGEKTYVKTTFNGDPISMGGSMGYDSAIEIMDFLEYVYARTYPGRAALVCSGS